jgi:hypothetical protein
VVVRAINILYRVAVEMLTAALVVEREQVPGNSDRTEALTENV